VRVRLVERSDALAFEVGQRLVGSSIANRERLRVDVVRLAHQDALFALACGFQAVHRDVEVASLERWDQIRPVVLDELRFDAQAFRELVRDVDFEPDDVVRVRRILVEVRLAALQIGAPGQLATLLDRVERAAVLAVAASDEQQQHGDGEVAHRRQYRVASSGTARPDPTSSREPSSPARPPASPAPEQLAERSAQRSAA